MTSKTEKQLQALVDEYKDSVKEDDMSSPSHAVVPSYPTVPITVDPDYNEREHRNIVEREPRRLREDPVAFMLNVGLYYQGTGWRGYKSYIGTRIIYPEFSSRMKEMVLNSKQAQHIIDVLADRQAERLQATQKKSKLSEAEQAKRLRKQRRVMRRELEVVAKAILDKCVASMDDIRIVRMFAFTVNNILVRLYHQGIHIKESEWVELKRVALHAQQHKQSLLILPSHKSHIDYLVVSYIMFRLGLQIPHIVAGDNLDLPIVGKVLRSCGAFFIRREWGDDMLYKTLMEEYIAVLLSEGRKLLTPKLGILKVILDAFVNGRFSDCYVVPISLGYDKIIETSSYANELLGNPKEKESLWGIITNTRLLQLKWGRVDARVGKPYSLKGWLDDQLKTRGLVFAGWIDDVTYDSSTLRPMDLSDNAQKSVLLKSLGYRVLSDINAISVVMPSALVGTVILTLRGRGVGRSELIRRVDWLTKVITAKGGNVAETHGMPTSLIVDRTLKIHKDLIGERKGKDILEPTFYGINPFELSYYRNQVIHLFVEEAIVCASLYTVVKFGGGKQLQRMKYADLLEEISFLSSLLKLDMIYKPGGVENNTQRTVQWLADNNVIEITQDGWVGLSDVERACGRENYDFLCFLIWPFVESYWLACVSLFSLANPNVAVQKGSIWVEPKLFANRTQALGKTLYYQGDLSYLEAVNKETLNQAFTRYEEQNIIVKRRHQTPKPWSEVALSNDYLPERQNGILMPRGHLWELVERIGRFRREGKNRRDNATVSTRVLRLAEILGDDNAVLSPNQKKRDKARL
ncbi:hypothetical protein DFQ28_005196 [Apophysomyces sp. BC1034]|nr:hypothetical protein DFQ28_005196 [Apophysomyces sp. BC1034]